MDKDIFKEVVVEPVLREIAFPFFCKIGDILENNGNYFTLKNNHVFFSQEDIRRFIELKYGK